ncbi:MAG: hypothetical protein WC750_06005 [Patescibacteria group bacterium]
MTDKKRVDCDCKSCFFLTKDGEKNMHVCQYCSRNKNAVEKEKDYSVAIKENGY